MYPAAGTVDVIIPERTLAVPVWQLEFAHVCPSKGEPEQRSGAPLGLEKVIVFWKTNKMPTMQNATMAQNDFFMAFKFKGFPY